MKLLLEKWRSYSKHLLIESQATSVIDDLLSATHASGRPINDAFQSPPALMETPSEDLTSAIVGFLDKNSFDLLVNGVGWGETDPWKPYEEASQQGRAYALAQIFKSVALFTGSGKGATDAVRDPETFEHGVTGSREASVVHLKDQKVDYETANTILTAIAGAPIDRSITDIYRGMLLENDVAKTLKVGDVFGGRSLASWSTSLSVATKFSQAKNLPANKRGFATSGKTMMIFHLPNPTQGGSISMYSSFGGEKEVVRTGALRIVDIEKVSYNKLVITCEEI
jgi:hypothetical protein